jgi:phenylalanyl-tRNA synthetase beta chain
VLANPKTAEYQIVRTTLLAGLLKTVRENKKHALPLRIFEVSDVAVKDPSEDRRARNIRRVAAVYVGKKAGFEQVHGLLDRLMLVLGVKRISEAGEGDFGYYIKGEDGALACVALWLLTLIMIDPTYFPDRSAKIYLRQTGKASQQTTLVDATYHAPPSDPVPDPEAVAAQASGKPEPQKKSTASNVADKLKSVFAPQGPADRQLRHPPPNRLGKVRSGQLRAQCARVRPRALLVAALRTTRACMAG